MTEETDLPPGWEWATFLEVAEINPRNGFQSVEDEQVVSFVPMAAVQEETGKIDLSIERTFSEVSKGYTRFVENDVIFAKITPCMENGKIAVARGLVNGLACGSTEFHVVRPAAGIASDYVRYFLVQRSFRRDAERQMQGAVGQKRVPAQYVQSSSLPIPPAAEQRRIVEKIDELFSLIEAGEQALARAAKLLERYRQSVLNAAVTGELTKDWREKHKGEIESGEDLLKRILKARRAAWEKAELAKLQARGKPPTDTRWKQKYKEPDIPDVQELIELPSGWVWASAAQLGFVSGGLTKNPSRTQLSRRLPYLRVANVYADELKLEDVDEIGVAESEVERVVLAPSDLLLVEGNGSKDQIGRVAIWDGNIPLCVHQNHIIKLRLIIPELSRWVLWWFLSQAGRDFIEDVASSTSGLYTLSISKVSSLVVPLPPLDEAVMLGDIVDREASSIGRAIADVHDESHRSAALRQSILAAAFSGRLVPQDPADEPASVLLQRICEERSAAARTTGPKMASRRGRPAKRTETAMAVTRKEVNSTHLRDILRASDGAMAADTLWKASDLDIDDFYKQLRDELAAGHLREERVGDVSKIVCL
jgi:type I restriction enzyme S subunit